MSNEESTYTPPDISLLGDEHIARYEETNGEVGYIWNGATCLVLHTIGRKTGQQRKFALIFAALSGPTRISTFCPAERRCKSGSANS